MMELGAGKTGRIVTAPFSEREAALKAVGIDARGQESSEAFTRYEAHMGYDFLSIYLPDFSYMKDEPTALEAFLSRDALLIFCDDAALRVAMEKAVSALREEMQRPDRALYAALGVMLTGDMSRLDRLEDDIESMEEQVSKEPGKDFPEKAIALRKSMLVMQRYYEGLFALLEDLEENENGFISDASLRGFHLLTNRVERLSRLVRNLRDYLTQVYEAYQNQIDINANQIMQFFTMIATIFLPLTLIVGWYGMNVDMPEYDSPFAYPVIIVVCVVTVVFCLWYFRKKRWF